MPGGKRYAVTRSAKRQTRAIASHSWDAASAPKGILHFLQGTELPNRHQVLLEIKTLPECFRISPVLCQNSALLK